MIPRSQDGRPAARLLITSVTIIVIGLVTGCGSGRDRSSPRQTTSTVAKVVPLDDHLALVNLRPRDHPFDSLHPWTTGIGYLRAWGGSRAMVTFPTEDAVPEVLRQRPQGDAFDVVQQADIDGLLALQHAHGTSLVYVVNINDTLDSQAAFIQRLVGDGLNIAMLEMGNEVYLPKFRNGDVTKLGVTRAWSADQYVSMLTEWGTRLRAIVPTVPIYGVGASHGSTDTGSDRARRAWNDTISTALGTNRHLIDGITFHHYTGDDPRSSVNEAGEEEISTADFGYLDTFGDLPIAMTETGFAFADMSTANLDRAEAFWAGLKAALKPGDVFGIHVMFNSSQRRAGASFALYNEAGRTAVGDRFARWIGDWAVDPLAE